MGTNLILIDGNSVGFAAQNGTKLTAGEREVQAIFGTLRSVRNLTKKFRTDKYRPLVLWDGRAEWRYQLFPGYKDRNNKNAKMDAMRESYLEQRPSIAKGLHSLGIHQLLNPGAEADDIAGNICRNVKGDLQRNVILATGDRDWMQLIDQNVTWMEHREERSRLVTMANFFNETGCKTTRQFIEAKALMGDTSDTIPGVGGFGEKGAVEFLATYGSVGAFLRQVEEGNVKKLSKAQQRLVNNESPPPSKKYGEMLPVRDAFERNLELMDLTRARTDIPPTQSVSGKYDEDKFRQFCESLAFNSILIKFDEWVEPFRELAR